MTVQKNMSATTEHVTSDSWDVVCPTLPLALQLFTSCGHLFENQWLDQIP